MKGAVFDISILILEAFSGMLVIVVLKLGYVRPRLGQVNESSGTPPFRARFSPKDFGVV